MRRSNELRRRYDDGESVLSLVKAVRRTPVNTFRAILTGRGWSKNRIKESLKSPKSKLKDRDYEQFQMAEEADRVSSVNQSETQSAAEVFEDILCSHFTELGVRYRKQSDLKSSRREEGRAIITPDLLLLDDVRITELHALGLTQSISSELHWDSHERRLRNKWIVMFQNTAKVQ